jgi:hypothetical protein
MSQGQVFALHSMQSLLRLAAAAVGVEAASCSPSDRTWQHPREHTVLVCVHLLLKRPSCVVSVVMICVSTDAARSSHQFEQGL